MAETHGAVQWLQRAWWFPALKGLRSGDQLATYVRYELDAQPSLSPAGNSFQWLEREPSHDEWAIDGGDDVHQVRKLSLHGLEAVAPTTVSLPAALWTLAERLDLQRRIRSATACYLDLGDFAARTTGDTHGVLIHLLSDQQWSRHWLLLADQVGTEAVVTTTEPIGFELPNDDPPPRRIVPLDGSLDLEVCADSFAEFVLRFWIENELYFRQPSELTEPLAAYAAQLRATDRST